MALGIIIGGWFASAVIGRLITNIEEHYKQEKSIKDELNKLKTSVQHIQAVVEAAESGQLEIAGELKSWLWELKKALYEADDVIDELDYLQLKTQVEVMNKKEQPMVYRALHKSNEKGKEIIKIVASTSDPMLNRLKAAVKMFDKVSSEVGNFIALASNLQRNQTTSSRETGPLLTETILFGRVKEREELKLWLTKPADDNLSLFSIVGHGGMGKTTLARHVYNDEEVIRSFHLRIWVFVSPEFDVKVLTAAVLESATQERPKVDSLSALQDTLKKKLLDSDKFLLVLDDAWNDENRSMWDTFFAPLRCGRKGSKILLTCRFDGVAEMAALAIEKKKESIKLEPIEKNVFFSLFERYAFAGVNANDYENLQSTGKKIAQRLGGSPLAAKTVGSLLRSNLNDVYWNNILNSKNISNQVENGGDNNIMSILLLSYHHLPAHLRLCFGYCAIFPQDHRYVKEDIVHIWMALGLIPQSSQESPEEIGGRYFDDLVKYSFLEQHYCIFECYSMHALLHELAQNLTSRESFRFVGDMSVDEIPHTVKHLYFKSNNINLLDGVDWKDLRTLVLVIENDAPQNAKVLEKVFKSLKSIRVLYIDVAGMEEFTDTFGTLRHLRIMSFGNARFPRFYDNNFQKRIQFPKLWCKLYHLQIFSYDSRCYDFILPREVDDLINLRHLMPNRLDGCICRIKKLISLHELSFSCSKESGFKIEELKDLNNLRKLKISSLENVKKHDESCMVDLLKKKHLLSLELGWTHGHSATATLWEEHEKVLDSLQPYSSIKELYIKNYPGSRHAKWMEPMSVENLKIIRFYGCSTWEHLPLLGKLPHLKNLYLILMPAVKTIDCEGGFPQLEVLEIIGLHLLEDFSKSDEEAKGWCPRLQKLKIQNCSNLSELPSLPVSLTELQLVDVGLTNLPTFWINNNCGGCSTSTLSPSSSIAQKYITSLQQFRSIKILKFWNCPKLHLPQNTKTDVNLLLPSSLQVLEFGNCGDLNRSLPLLLQKSYTISLLSLIGCNNMTSLPSEQVWRELTLIKRLRIEGCNELESLESLKVLNHLNCLSISKCPKLKQAGATTADAEQKYNGGGCFTLTVKWLDIDDPSLLLTEPLRSLTSVQSLSLMDCSGLQTIKDHVESWFLQNRTSLREAFLFSANNVQNLPASLQSLSSLNFLSIHETNSLQSLPLMPPSLYSLRINDCTESLLEKFKNDLGVCWPNIPLISIGTKTGQQIKVEYGVVVRDTTEI